MISCPQCHSERIHHSKRVGAKEKVLLSAICFRPFRCERCDVRFFRWSLSTNPNASRRRQQTAS